MEYRNTVRLIIMDNFARGLSKLLRRSYSLFQEVTLGASFLNNSGHLSLAAA